MSRVIAANPFRFATSLYLIEALGRKAKDIKELISHLKEVPSSSIYYHTHHFLQQHQYLSPEPPNDFAYWVRNVLGDKILGEILFSLDILRFSHIEDLRISIIQTIENYVNAYPDALGRFATSGYAFHFMTTVHFILPLPYEARTLEEFYNILQNITINSIYHHMFDARLRLGSIDNDFSRWLRDGFHEEGVAEKISSLDPYTYTLEELRTKILSLIKGRLYG